MHISVTGAYSPFPSLMTSSRTIWVPGFPEKRRKRGETVEEQIDLLSESAHIPVTFAWRVPNVYKGRDGAWIGPWYLQWAQTVQLGWWHMRQDFVR